MLILKLCVCCVCCSLPWDLRQCLWLNHELALQARWASQLNP